ncbi:MAG: hypothetical protein Q4D06_04990 [Coriobacteriia bacterium]|nr:hypothetical protein [Coriobacteriia bacterium]
MEKPAPDRTNPFKTIELCDDGTFRWVYELNMVTNPVIALTLSKVFFFVFLGIAVFVNLLDVFDGRFDWASFLEIARMFLALWLVMSVLAWVSSAAYALIAYGGKYCVLFEMDEKGLVHRQLPKQFERAQAVALLAALAGVAAGKPGVAGANLLAATKSESSSDFSVVRSVKRLRLLSTIKVNEPFSKNQVYVPREDFDAVYDYIVTRCPRINK